MTKASRKRNEPSTAGSASSSADPPPSVGQERVLRQLIATTQDAVIFIDDEARIVLFNAAAESMFGYAASEVIGEKVNVLMGAPYRDEHDGYIEHYERTGDKRAIGTIRSVVGVRNNGVAFPIELSVTELSGGGRVRYGAFLRDVSEKVALQEKLLERERLAAMGSAAAMLAHEIGNPLNNMYIQAQIMRRGFDRDPEVNERHGGELEVLIGEVRRLMRLLEEFRLVSRRSTRRFEPVDLAELISRVGKQLQASAGRCRVETALAVDEAVVQGDVDKLHQLVVNLGKNAIEAMAEGGELTLGVEEDGEQLVLVVADRGPGIAADVDILEPFKTTKKDGTGLGLTVVSQIVRAHGAELSWSERPGGGTVFRVVFAGTSRDESRSTGQRSA